MTDSPAATCPQCGAPATAGSPTCAYCGAQLSGFPSAGAPAAPPLQQPPMHSPAPFAPPPSALPPPTFQPPPMQPMVTAHRSGGGAVVGIIIASVVVLMVVIGGVVAFVGVSGMADGVSGPVSVGPQAPLLVGQSVRGTFGPGLPTDPSGNAYVEYPLAVTSPGAFTITLTSDNTSNYDPYLRLLQNGQQIASNDDGAGGLNSRLIHTLMPGTYSVRVGKFGSGQAYRSTGYTLMVTGPPQMPAAAPMPTPTPGVMPGTMPTAIPAGSPLPIGPAVGGVFSPSLPTDARGYPYIDYPLTVTRQGTYTISLTSSQTSSYDPYIRLMAGGREIAHDDDGAGSLNSRLTHYMAPGAYVVRVTKFGSGPARATVPFTLRVTGPM